MTKVETYKEFLAAAKGLINYAQTRTKDGLSHRFFRSGFLKGLEGTLLNMHTAAMSRFKDAEPKLSAEFLGVYKSMVGKVVEAAYWEVSPLNDGSFAYPIQDPQFYFSLAIDSVTRIVEHYTAVIGVQSEVDSLVAIIVKRMESQKRSRLWARETRFKLSTVLVIEVAKQLRELGFEASGCGEENADEIPPYIDCSYPSKIEESSKHGITITFLDRYARAA